MGSAVRKYSMQQARHCWQLYSTRSSRRPFRYPLRLLLGRLRSVRFGLLSHRQETGSLANRGKARVGLQLESVVIAGFFNDVFQCVYGRGSTRFRLIVLRTREAAEQGAMTGEVIEISRIVLGQFLAEIDRLSDRLPPLRILG